MCQMEFVGVARLNGMTLTEGCELSRTIEQACAMSVVSNL